MQTEELLSSYCSGSDIVIAVPTEMDAKRCAKLAKPILNDASVKKMMDSLAEPLDEGTSTNTTDTTVKEAEDPAEAKEDKADKENSSDKENKGAKDNPDKENNPDKEKNPDKENELNKENEDAEFADKTHAQSDVVTSKSNASDQMKEISSQPDETVKPIPAMPFLFGALIMVLIAFMYKVQENITSPLQPGDILSPGQWRSRCGVFSSLPKEYTGCSPSKVLLTEDATFHMYEDNDIVLTIQGSLCSNNKKNKKNCVDGVEVQDDGSIHLGGTLVQYVNSNEPISLSPWPFETAIPQEKFKRFFRPFKK